LAVHVYYAGTITPWGWCCNAVIFLPAPRISAESQNSGSKWKFSLLVGAGNVSYVHE